MSRVEVNWYEDKVRLAIDRSLKGSSHNIALRIEERVKVNISKAPGASGQGLVDTGFMINSVYTATHKESTYSKAQKSGTYRNRAGEMVRREITPEIELHKYAEALVAVGADYAIYQEIEHGFFIRAVEETGKEIAGLIEPIGRQERRL